MYHSSCNKIVKYIQDADYFLHQLFMPAKEDPKKQEDIMKYVIELCIMSKQAEAAEKEAAKKEAEEREAEAKEVEEVEVAQVEIAGSRRKRSSSEAEVEDSDRPHKDIRLDEDKSEMSSHPTASSSQKRSSRDAELEDDDRPQKGARLGRE
ncbi:hypothetical protein BD560DRAFT_424049 [Blakeslea trispora]|nr:hypothetical protein BD560DRAFT_424049 [Blakeslea trispora]